jgi:regulator of replication initiation timing
MMSTCPRQNGVNLAATIRKQLHDAEFEVEQLRWNVAEKINDNIRLEKEIKRLRQSNSEIIAESLMRGNEIKRLREENEAWQRLALDYNFTKAVQQTREKGDKK